MKNLGPHARSLLGETKVIEAVEVQERVVTLKHPIKTGMYLGIGLILAPFILWLFIMLIGVIAALLAGASI